MDRIETWITETLRRQTGQTLSLQRLHDGLVREFGAAAGSYYQLYQRLKQTRSIFQVRERAHPLTDEITWPADIRQQYAQALRNAGIDLSPLVVLAAAPAVQETGILGVLEQTLCALRDSSASDQLMAADLANAFNELPALQSALESELPTTTVLRDPASQP